MRARTLLSIITSVILLSGVGTGANALTNRGEAPASPQTIAPISIDLERDELFSEQIAAHTMYSQAEHDAAVKAYLEAEAAAKLLAEQEAAAKAKAERLAAAKAATAAGNRGAPRSSTGTEQAVSQDVHDWLADCETGKRTPEGNVIPGTRRNDDDGVGFDGYFQFLPSTWTRMGNEGRAYQHSYATQKAQAQRIPISSWGTQFPDCNRRLRRMGII